MLKEDTIKHVRKWVKNILLLSFMEPEPLIYYKCRTKYASVKGEVSRLRKPLSRPSHEGATAF
jgi:hypothetical protein